MGTNRSTASNALILGAMIALTSSIAYAAPTFAPQGATVVAAASDAGRAASATGSGDTAGFPSGEAGVRRATAEGPESLRRYIQRTRMIYNYYYWSFAKEQ
jgi:hypothetical protein